MAVYTHISAEDMAELIDRYNVGTLISAKGIAEGVQNSNYLIDTTKGRFVLTVYEHMVDSADLPFFLALLNHLAEKGCPVPQSMRDNDGETLVQWNGKLLALIEFLPGLSVTSPTPAQAAAVGKALGQMHLAVADFPLSRPNALGLENWEAMAARCGDSLDQITPGLKVRVEQECLHMLNHWPADLPQSIIHADLFPDNVLMRGDDVGGMIDFYFACTEARAFDLAVTHMAWSFSSDGRTYSAAVGDALIAGYESSLIRSAAEKAAFPVLARGACLRFLLTRAWDWLNTPADALVNKHDPLAMVRRLDHYAQL
ncbi:MAG: homoserine kinase [Sphingomonadaceae bacterium]